MSERLFVRLEQDTLCGPESDVPVEVRPLNAR
jgi:hypothetical protein